MLQAARAELDAERRRAAELEQYMGQQRGTIKASPRRSITNKKDEDSDFDVEAAVLTGGAGNSFQPLAGQLKRASFPLNLKAVVAGAHQLDRVAVALDHRPGMRALASAYFVLLHAAVVFF